MLPLVLAKRLILCHTVDMLTAEGPTNALINLFHQGTRLRFNKNDFIIRPGSPPSGIFYIAQGLVKAYEITKYGDENLLIIRKTGEILGLTWAVTGDDRQIIYTALAPTTVFRVEREQFLEHINQNPATALPLVDMLVDMYRSHSERIINLEYRSVRERLVSFLFTTARRFGTQTEAGLLLEVPMRHQDIASSISATRETTSRELATLERQGLITSKQSMITIVDAERLRRYLE